MNEEPREVCCLEFRRQIDVEELYALRSYEHMKSMTNIVEDPVE
jgi:hypothetical protein